MKYEVIIAEVDGHILAYIPGERASTDLTAVGTELLETLVPAMVNLGMQGKSWYFFNRLINESGKAGLGTLLLNKVLGFCKQHHYSILNQVNAYGKVPQKALENWYISKGFKPVDYKKYKNAVLKWESR